MLGEGVMALAEWTLPGTLRALYATRERGAAAPQCPRGGRSRKARDDRPSLPAAEPHLATLPQGEVVRLLTDMLPRLVQAAPPGSRKRRPRSGLTRVRRGEGREGRQGIHVRRSWPAGGPGSGRAGPCRGPWSEPRPPCRRRRHRTASAPRRPTPAPGHRAPRTPRPAQRPLRPTGLCHA